MHKILLFLLLGFTLLFSAQTATVTGLDPNGDGFLSLRTKPKGKEIGKLYNGNKVEILKKKGKYYKVKVVKSGMVGYAHSNWIRKIYTSKASSSSSTSSSHKKGKVYGLDPNGDGFLSLRNKPKGKQIGKLYNGDNVNILASRGKWYKVKLANSGQVGWAHGNWVRVDNKKSIIAEKDKQYIETMTKSEAIKKVKIDYKNFEKLPKNFRKDKEVVLAAVTQNGYALQYADDSLKKDKEVVLAAITQDRDALEYADDSLRKDRDILRLINAPKYKEAKELCDKKDSSGCNYLGKYYSSGKEIEKDYDKAYKFFEKACDLGSILTCYNLGVRYHTGNQRKQDYNKAKIFYNKACDKGNAQACSNLGLLYDNNKIGNNDYMKAIIFYDKACDGGEGNGCYNLGHSYLKGKGEQIQQDYSKAVKYYEKACAVGHADGCFNSGILYSNGRGVEKDYHKAKNFYLKACNGKKAKGCVNLASIYYEGKGTQKDTAMAKDFLKRACDLGEEMSCKDYEILNEESKNSKSDIPHKSAGRYPKDTKDFILYENQPTWNAQKVSGAIEATYGKIKPISGMIKLSAPKLAASPNRVPIAVRTNISLKTIALFTDSNPRATIILIEVIKDQPINFSLGIKMNKSGIITVIGEGMDGKFYSDKVMIEVAVGGMEEMGVALTPEVIRKVNNNPSLGVIKIKAKERAGLVKTKVEIEHKMLNFYLAKKRGQEPNFITKIAAFLQDKAVLNMTTSPNLSQNPRIKFSFKGKKGDKLKIIYEQINGEVFYKNTVIK